MKVLAIQYRRKIKRLQLILLPYQHTVSVAALMRLTPAHEAVDPLRAWRVVGIYGMSQTLQLGELEPFEADVACESLLQSEWVQHEATVMEGRALVEVDASDVGVLVGSRLPTSLITAIKSEIDMWV